jgi:hypothetical protein
MTPYNMRLFIQKNSNNNIVYTRFIKRSNWSANYIKNPYTNEMDYLTKIQVTFWCLLCIQKFKQKKSALAFAYFIRQLIETRKLPKRCIRQIITEYFYIIAVQIYYIFEIRLTQIYNTEQTTINTIMYFK